MEIHQSNLSTPSSKRPWSTPNPSVRYNLQQGESSMSHSTGVDAQSLIGHSLKLQDWLSEKNVKYVQEKADLEAKETKKMYNNILKTEDTFVKDIDQYLEEKEKYNLRKKEILHKKWNDRIYEPLRKNINRAMSGPAYSELDKRKRQLHKEYIEFSNQKGHVFLDTYPEDEYYPMGLHPVRPYHIKVSTSSSSDPLTAQERERNVEDRTVLNCVTGTLFSDKDLDQIRLPPLPLVPLGRHGTECKTWLAMPLHDIESPVRQASMKKMRGDYNYSHFNFKNWGQCSDAIQTIDKEMQVQRRKNCRGHPSLSYPSMTNHMVLGQLRGAGEMPIPPQTVA